MAWKSAVEHLEGAVGGAAKAINSLVIITDRGNAVRRSHQTLEQLYLRVVRVLELIDEDVAEAVAVPGEIARFTVPQAERLADQAAKACARGSLQQLPAAAEDTSQLFL